MRTFVRVTRFEASKSKAKTQNYLKIFSKITKFCKDVFGEKIIWEWNDAKNVSKKDTIILRVFIIIQSDFLAKKYKMRDSIWRPKSLLVKKYLNKKHFKNIKNIKTQKIE